MCGPRRNDPPKPFGVSAGGKLPNADTKELMVHVFISTFKTESKISHFSFPLNKRSPLDVLDLKLALGKNKTPKYSLKHAKICFSKDHTLNGRTSFLCLTMKYNFHVEE